MDSCANVSEPPLLLGTPEVFAGVREFFDNIGFDDQRLCQVLSLDDMSDLGRVQWEKFEGHELPASLRACLQVFIRGIEFSERDFREACGERVLAQLRSLGLVCPAKTSCEKILSPIWLYPADGFVIASDRRSGPEGDPSAPLEDVVFPAIYSGTLRFLRLLPQTRGVDALDLCGGSGIGALHLSRTARSSVSADLTKRSAFFAEFNARLNGASMESLCGDCYSPVQGRSFDLITAHPPFVPSVGPRIVYRDAGESGEDITRRIVEGLPNHLRPGGTSVIVCVARDTVDAPFERRVREWLGGAAGEFDILFGIEKTLTTEEVVESMSRRGQNISESSAKVLLQRLRSLGTRQFVYGTAFIRRTTNSAPSEPFRIQTATTASAEDFEHLLAWRKHARQPDFPAWIAQSRPRLSPDLALTARHVVREGELVPAEFVFSVDNSFRAALRPDPWIVPLLARFNGRRTVREVFENAGAEGDLPDGFDLQSFAALVQKMIDRDLFKVDF